MLIFEGKLSKKNQKRIIKKTFCIACLSIVFSLVVVSTIVLIFGREFIDIAIIVVPLAELIVFLIVFFLLKYFWVIIMTSPFDNLTKAQISKLYELLGVHIYSFSENQEILPTIKNENIVGIILEGYAQILNIEYNGNEIVIDNLYKDSVFGTNISLTNSENYQIIAKQDTDVLVIDYDKLINPQNLNHNYFNIFFRNLFDIINIKMKEKNERIKVLEKKQIREKLLEYFEMEYKKGHLNNKIFLSFSFKDLADYLAINRSAMFRELKHLKEEKLIEVNNRKVTLLYK